MKIIRDYAGITIAAALVVTQYILAFFVFNLAGPAWLNIAGWVIWALSLYFGIAPIFILRHKGGVAQGQSYIHTTRLVDTNLYAIVRHPQYLAGILFSLALMLLSPHWQVILPGAFACTIIWWDIQVADRQALEKFGQAYQDYSQRVPQVNILLGLYRLLRRKS